MAKSDRFENEIWGAYIDALRRLEALVNDETSCLSDGDWQGIVTMMGKIENAQITLRHYWQKLVNAGMVPNEKDSKDVDSPKRQKAASLLRNILEKKSVNEKLIREEMENLKKGIVRLKKTRDSHIKYLEQGKKSQPSLVEITN